MIKRTLLVALLLLISVIVSAIDLQLYTEEYPPYNFEKDGKLQGIAIDMMELILQEAGTGQSKSDIQLVPWSRGYNLIQRDPNVCLFSMTKSKERENMFKWVGPVAKTTIVLYAMKDSGIKINSEADLANYTTTVVKDDIGEQLMLNAVSDKSKVDASANSLACVRKLYNNRVNLWAYESNVGKWVAKSNKFDTSKLVPVYTLSESELYFAFSKNTDDATIKKFQAAYDKLKKAGKFDAILKAYQ